MTMVHALAFMQKSDPPALGVSGLREARTELARPGLAAATNKTQFGQKTRASSAPLGSARGRSCRWFEPRPLVGAN